MAQGKPQNKTKGARVAVAKTAKTAKVTGESIAPSITAQKDGPLEVSGIALENSRGEPVKTRKKYYLCRCGWSKNRPFCDGTHTSIGFKSAKEPDRQPDRIDRYRGKKISIIDNRGLCAHAGICSTELSEVWQTGVEPWINADGASPKAIIDIIRRCPSGALGYVDEKGAVRMSLPHVGAARIRVDRDGPYHLRGAVEMKGMEVPEGASENHFALCRCGHSKNKPFCDGRHWYAGFRDNEDETISAARRAQDEGKEEWAVVSKSSALVEGGVVGVVLGEKSVVLVRRGGRAYALDGLCPHQGGPMAEGSLCVDGTLRCPWHGYRFDLKTGRNAEGEADAETLKLREEGGRIEVLVPRPKRSSWTVGHLIAETLAEWGVDTVFGMVGHSNLGMAEGVRVLVESGRMRYFGVRHEGAAAFAASGYAKVLGTPAACLTIAGPGATNLLTGLWDARMDRVPVIALTGQVNTQFLGPGAFQEVDLAAAFSAVSAFSQTVLHDSDHASLASLACKNALVQRDVSHLILPDEVQVLDAGVKGPGRPEGRLSSTAIKPPDSSVATSSYRIASARRPLIIVGYGAREGMDEVLALASHLRCAVATTFKAKGQVSDDHPWGAGVLGRSGTPIASTLMNESDLLIVFGASFANHTGITASKPIIQVDFDRMTLGKFHAVSEPVWGDVAMSARAFREALPEKIACKDGGAHLAKLRREWRGEKRKRAAVPSKRVNSPALFSTLSKVVPKEAVIAVDVGNNAYSFGRYFHCRDGQSVLMSGYLGSIGFGFPAAMGAWAAVGDRRKVVCVAGDGGFGQYMADFTTAVRYDMDITLILVRNDELGKISKEQRDGEFQVWETGLHSPDFSRYAKLCGGEGIRVTRASDLESAFRRGLAYKGAALVEVLTDPASW
ncbi:MAG: thiamine pyrophosphate-binding protein [Alphaproteobacteria bacterium]